MNELTYSDNEYERKYQTFVKRLKTARKEAGYTQIEVSKLLDKTQSYISKIERGVLRLDVVQLLDFAKLYSKPLDFFVEGIE